VLADFGLGFGDVLRVNIYMTDLAQFEGMDRVYSTFFQPGRFPARTTVGVASLLLGGQIEIDCMARLRAGEPRS
jgi:2-iminobutanoate/2-iminopropanoate deaminase